MIHQIRSSKVICYPHRRLGARLALSGVCLVTPLSAVGVARPLLLKHYFLDIALGGTNREAE